MSIGGSWTIDVDMGTAIEVDLVVRDSVAPGDLCWGPSVGDGIITEGGTYTYETQASTLNACGYEFDDADPALAFIVRASYRGPAKRATPATITSIRRQCPRRTPPGRR